MISGSMTTEGEAIIRLTVRGPTGQESKIEAVIDTGFDGWLSLPPDTIAELELPWSSLGRAALADGRKIDYDLYKAVVLWDRRQRLIEVDEADTAPLVGMAMLEGFELNVQVWSRGKVTITTRGRRSR